MRGGTTLQVRNMQIRGEVSHNARPETLGVLCKLEVRLLSSGSYSGEGVVAILCQSEGACTPTAR